MSSSRETSDNNNESVFTILDLSNSASQLPSSLYQPRNSFFNRKQSTPTVQQLLLRQNRLTSLSIYAKSLTQFKQHLTELSLRENLLTEFPMEITVLKNLTLLSLANNQIESIPCNSLSELPNLLWLNLSHNKLTELPVDIVCCHHLRGIDIESNQFTSFPRVVCYLAHLEVLLIQKNKIKCIPPNHDLPPTLNTFNIAFNLLTQVPLTLIHKPPESLTHLHLSGNKFGILSPQFLSTGYQNLVSLDLHTCHLTHCSNRFFQYLSECKQLRRLNLAINRLTQLPPDIGLLSQLQWLNLNDNLLTHLPSTMTNLIHLVKLGLVQNRLEELPPFMFSHMLDLQKLDIRRNQLKYMPPSVLALAPRQEVDIHVDLAAPYTVFNTLSNPSCPREESCLSNHPYGGSLRTLLFYENQTMEHVDGILCQVDEDQCVQVISLSHAYDLLQQSHRKSALQQEIKNTRFYYCHHGRFRQPESTTPTLLTEIDEDQAVEDDEEDDDVLKRETSQALTKIPSLKELSLRTYLSLHCPHLKRIDRRDEQRTMFLKQALPDSYVPAILYREAEDRARQCDYCQDWFMESKYQVGYLVRLCNNRIQIPVRFKICTMDCALDAVVKLYDETTGWHTKQSLAHIDAALSIQSYWSQPPVVIEEERTTVQNNPSSSSSSSSSTSSSTQGSESINSTPRSSGSGNSSFGTTLRNRLSQFASSFFNTNEYQIEVNHFQPQRANLHVFRDNSQMIPLIYPLSAGIRPQEERRLSTSRLVEGRLQIERTQPPLRLSTPTPNPAVFNHLPRDALRLERF